MRTNILSLAICAAAMLPMYSCNDDKPLPPAEEKTGSLDLSSLGVEVEEKENEAESRAVAEEETPLQADSISKDTSRCAVSNK